MLRIDPTQMNSYESEALDFFLSSNPDQTLISSGAVYQFLFPNPKTNYTESKKIILTYDLIKRSCQPAGKNNGQYRYEVVTDHSTLASGAYAQVYRTTGTFVPTQGSKAAHYKTRERVFKFIPISPELKVENIHQEFHLTPDYLGMKPPVMLNDGWCLLMRKMDGSTLSKILWDDRDGIHKLTMEQRLSLCLALADALQTQIHDNQRVHRDIKPDNIMVKYNTADNKWKINIIDFGFAKSIDADDRTEKRGTPIYISPEAWHGKGTTIKSDIYALACIFSEILGCTRESIIQSYDELEDEFANGNIFLDNIFKNINDKDSLDQKEFVRLLRRMTKTQPDKRPDASETAATLHLFSIFNTENIKTLSTKARKSLSTSGDTHPEPLKNHPKQ